MNQFPTLYTERLKLRKIKPEDIPNLVRYANNKKIADHIINIPHPYGEPDATFRIGFVVNGFKKKIRYAFSVCLKTTDELIGEMSLHLNKDRQKAELGYWLGEPYWNKGLTTEAAKAILQFGFETIELQEIIATCYEDNPASMKVLTKNGMEKAGKSGRVVQYFQTKDMYEQLTPNV